MCVIVCVTSVIVGGRLVTVYRSVSVTECQGQEKGSSGLRCQKGWEETINRGDVLFIASLSGQEGRAQFTQIAVMGGTRRR